MMSELIPRTAGFLDIAGALVTSSDSVTPLDADAFARLAVELHDAGDFDDTIEAVVQFALQAENCTYAAGHQPREPGPNWPAR
jgi:hypothetical protein